MSVLAVHPLFRLALAARVQSARRRWHAASTPAEILLNASDGELVSQYLAGEPQAFAELVKRHARSIYNVTYRFTNDAPEAENLTQETFLRAWNALPRLQLDKPLKPYLIRVAVNLCHDWAERQHVRVVPLDAEEENHFSDEANDPLRAVSDQELRQALRAKLEELPPLYRTVIALRYGEELSYHEMAAALDLPLNTVRTHLHRAKMKLRALLEQDYGR